MVKNNRSQGRKILTFVFPLLFCSLFTFDVANAETYKWKDKDGNSHYADSIYNVPEEFRNQIPGYEGYGADETAEEATPTVSAIETDHPYMFTPTPRPEETGSFSLKSILAKVGKIGAIGLVAAMAGYISVLVIAFKENPSWGAMCIVIPPITLLYIGIRWYKTKIPFAILASGSVAIVAGVIIGK